jgi:hypothetical protein
VLEAELKLIWIPSAVLVLAAAGLRALSGRRTASGQSRARPRRPGRA